MKRRIRIRVKIRVKNSMRVKAGHELAHHRGTIRIGGTPRMARGVIPAKLVALSEVSSLVDQILNSLGNRLKFAKVVRVNP